YLIDTGYLAKEDWEEIKKAGGKIKDPLTELLKSGYISPHAVRDAKKDQMTSDLKGIIRSKTISMNFSPGPGKTTTEGGLTLADLFTELNSTIDEALDVEYLRAFLKDHLGSGLRPLDSLNYSHPVWTIPMVDKIKQAIKPVPD